MELQASNLLSRAGVNSFFILIKSQAPYLAFFIGPFQNAIAIAFLRNNFIQNKIVKKMKNEISNFFKTDRTFDKGVALYMKYGISVGLKKTLNLQGYSKYNQDVLFEQLRSMAEINQVDFQIMLSKPVEKVILKVVEPEKEPEVTPTSLNEVPLHIKKTIRLRDEFPFLSSPDCPPELKILVSDMLTAYDNYVEAHKDLFEADDNESALKAVAATVENYLENQSIWDELNHYKATGEILGKHLIFQQNTVLQELQKLTIPELYKRKSTLYNAIARKKKQLKDEDKPELTKQRQDSLTEKETEFKEVLRLLNINE